MEQKVEEVWLLRVHRPRIKEQPAGWYDVAAFLTPGSAQTALTKLNALGRVVPDPSTITEANPNGNSWELKRLEVRA